MLSVSYLNNKLLFSYEEHCLNVKLEMLLSPCLQISQVPHANEWVIKGVKQFLPLIQPSFLSQNVPEQLSLGIQTITDPLLKLVVDALHQMFDATSTMIKPYWERSNSLAWGVFVEAKERLKTVTADRTALPATQQPINSNVLAVMLIMALLSSFTMADIKHDSSLQKVVLGLGMLGATVFNFMGGTEYMKSHGKEGTKWSYVVCGVLSAIAPAIMTFFGVGSFGLIGAYYILPMLAAVSNFLFSVALGAKGTEKVWVTIVEFLEGDYHSVAGYGADGSSRMFTRVIAVIELVIYTVLSFYLMSSRTYETIRFMRDAPSGRVDLRSLKKDSWYWGSTALSTVANLPEGAMFLMCMLKLRMKAYGTIKHVHACYKGNETFDWWSLVSFSAALGMAFSFYKVYVQIGEEAAEKMFEDWAKTATKEGLVKQVTEVFTSPAFVGQYSGIAAGLLVAGEGSTLQNMFTLFVAGCKAAWAKCSCCGSIVCRRRTEEPEKTALFGGVQELKEVSESWQRNEDCGSWSQMFSRLWSQCCACSRVKRNYNSDGYEVL